MRYLKTNTDSEISQSVVQQNHVLSYFIEQNNDVKLKVKKSNGDIVQIGGTSLVSDVAEIKQKIGVINNALDQINGEIV